MDSVAGLLALGLAVKRAPRRPPKKSEIRIEPGIDFEATHVVYRVTVRNRGEAIARDVLITPKILHGPFVLDVIVPYTEHVLPFIPAGSTVADMIWKV